MNHLLRTVGEENFDKFTVAWHLHVYSGKLILQSLFITSFNLRTRPFLLCRALLQQYKCQQGKYYSCIVTILYCQGTCTVLLAIDAKPSYL